VIVGSVYIVNTTLARPAKDKITVCVCAADNLFFWINTNARKHGVGQFQLSAADHQALTHDCFLDCSRLTTFLGHELRAAQDRGVISSQLAKAIVEFLVVNAPKTLPPVHLELAIENLQALCK
jgi:hypothetical protein